MLRPTRRWRQSTRRPTRSCPRTTASVTIGQRFWCGISLSLSLSLPLSLPFSASLSNSLCLQSAGAKKLNRGELYLAACLLFPLFGDLVYKLKLKEYEALGGHFSTNGVALCITIRLAPWWLINGELERRFPILPYTAAWTPPKDKTTKQKKARVYADSATELPEDALVVAIDPGACGLLISSSASTSATTHVFPPCV